MGDVNYFDLIERNNELAERLLNVLSPVTLPLEMRPYPGWQWTVPIHTGNVHDLRITVSATANGMNLELIADGYQRLWRHVLEYKDLPPAEVHPLYGLDPSA